jgi:hypothetical protein
MGWPEMACEIQGERFSYRLSISRSMKTAYFALVDDRLVEDTLVLRRTLGKPYLKKREPVIDPGQSFGSVLRDKDGLWRMWYITFQTRDPSKDLVGCATPQRIAYSRDGIEWERPSLGLVSEGGSRQNNIILGEKQRDRNGRYLTGYGGVSSFCVIDNETHPHPCTRARFTALYTAYPVDSIGGILMAHSDDGLEWTAYPENAVFPGGQDTQNILIHDPRIGKYVCYHRPMIYCGVANHANRKMARCESDDLVRWTPGRVVLDTDERDAPAWEFFDEPGMRGMRGRVMQFQGMTPWISNGCYLALAWMYDSRVGTFDLELVHSPDGVHWQREALREPFIKHGFPDGFRGKLPVPNGTAPIFVGDEEYFYVSSSPHGHHEVALADTGKGSAEDRRKLLETTSIYLLAVKRDRWVSYDAGEREGELLTTPIEWKGGGSLRLNASIEAGGSIRVEIEDRWSRSVKDFHLDEIPPINGPLDAVDHVVPFGPGPKTIMVIPQVGPIRFRFWLKKAKLYGWSFTG